MNRFVISLFFSLIPYIAYCQYEGTYVLGGGFVEWRIKLLPNHKFNYSYADDCSPGKIGMGWYSISPFRLELHFENDTTTQGDTGKAEIGTLAPKDINSCSIEINVKDEYMEPLLQAAIMDIVNGKPTGTGAVTDFDGNALLRIDRKKVTRVIRISYVGYKSIDIPLNLSNDYKINTSLAWRFPQKISAGVVYKIRIRHRQKGIVLVNKYGEKYRKT